VTTVAVTSSPAVNLTSPIERVDAGKTFLCRKLVPASPPPGNDETLRRRHRTYRDFPVIECGRTVTPRGYSPCYG
jgi:hypothetical protein